MLTEHFYIIWTSNSLMPSLALTITYLSNTKYYDRNLLLAWLLLGLQFLNNLFVNVMILVYTVSVAQIEGGLEGLATHKNVLLKSAYKYTKFIFFKKIQFKFIPFLALKSCIHFFLSLKHVLSYWNQQRLIINFRSLLLNKKLAICSHFLLVR